MPSFDKKYVVKIKWPNDLYIGNEKVGGILCQSDYRNGVFVITSGKLARMIWKDRNNV